MTTISSTSTGTTTAPPRTSSGSTSDIDWNGLLEAAVQAKLTRADAIDKRITANDVKVAAFQKMQSLLQTIKSAAHGLRAPSGTLNKSSDVFQSRAAYFTANGNVDAASTLAATVVSGAPSGSFNLSVQQLAKAHKVAGDTQASKDADLGMTGTFRLGLAGGAEADVAVTADMSLSEIAAAINAKSATTKVQASILMVGASDYRLVLTASETGHAINASLQSGDDVLNALGVTDAGGAFANILQDAKDAIFTVDGLQITRDSNDVDDVVSGVTLHLYTETPAGTSIDVEIGANLSTIKQTILDLVDAYNLYRDFAYQQQQLSLAGTEEAPLFGDGTLRSVNTMIADVLNTMVDDKSMALLGLEFDSTNHLTLDEDKLDSVLLGNLEAVQKLLSFHFESSSSKLMLLSRGTVVPPANFTLDVTVDGSGTLTSASVGGDSSLFTISGNTIKGAVGSAYEGLSFVFTGNTSQSIAVSTSVGLAERFYNAVNQADGTIGDMVGSIGEATEMLQQKSDDIRADAETFRTTLANRFAQYQAAISAAQASTDYLTALIDSWNSKA